MALSTITLKSAQALEQRPVPSSSVSHLNPHYRSIRLRTAFLNARWWGGSLEVKRNPSPTSAGFRSFTSGFLHARRSRRLAHRHLAIIKVMQGRHPSALWSVHPLLWLSNSVAMWGYLSAL